MTTGRINQVTILKPPTALAASSKVVRFAKNMIPPRSADTTGRTAQRVCFRDLQSTRPRLAKYISIN
jgi:hypothetical protein